MQIIQLVTILVSILNLGSGSSWLCSDCKKNAACIKECANLKSVSTTLKTTTIFTTTTRPTTTIKTSTKWRPKTKPSWWIPLPCKLCLGWVSRRNATIRRICRYGCGNGQPGLSTTTTTTMTTTLQTTNQPSSASLPSTTAFWIKETTPTTLETVTREFRQQQRLAVRLSTVTRHTNYIWFLIGIVGVGFLVTSFFVIRKYTSVKQRIGVVNIEAQEQAEIIHISRPFTLP
eukprot:TCONS_00057350-protein